MTSLIIPLPFVLFTLEKVEKKTKKNTKIWISQEQKELFWLNKKHFHSFWRTIIWRKNNNLIKIADKSFKLKRAKNLAPVLQIVQKITENYCPSLYLSTGPVLWLHELLVQKIYLKMHLVSCNHRDITVLNEF